MCGRYLLRNQPQWATHNPWKDYWRDIGQFTPRFNIAPSQSAPVIVWEENQPCTRLMTWGFRPSWAKASFAKINARSESMFTSKMFSESASSRRCLIIADGFYEPEGASSARHRPWHVFEYEDHRVFAMAGIWTPFQSIEQRYENFAILTTEANQLVGSIHHRMPILIEQNQWNLWLYPSSESGIKRCLEVREYTDMRETKVGDSVKNPRNEGPQCVDPPVDPNLTLF